jgi:hypothetical protein
VWGVAGRLECLREWSERREKFRFPIGVACGGARSAAAQSRGEKGEGRGVPDVGVPRGARGLVGSGPDRRVAPAATRARYGWATCAARARSVGDRAGERGRADRWAGTVTGGGIADRLGRPVSGTWRARARARERACARGPAREEKGIGPPDCTVPFWNCLNYFE